MDEMMTSDLALCAENVRVGWGLMLSGQSQIERGQADYVEGVLRAAEAFVKARNAMNNDAEFGKWCSDNGLSLRVINHNDRAALIRIGRNLPYWRNRLEAIKGRPPSLRLLVMDVPDEEVSQLGIPPRHQTKPGPKPAPSDDEAAEFERLVEEGRKIVADAKAAETVRQPTPDPARDDHAQTAAVADQKRAEVAAQDARVRAKAPKNVRTEFRMLNEDERRRFLVEAITVADILAWTTKAPDTHLRKVADAAFNAIVMAAERNKHISLVRAWPEKPERDSDTEGTMH
jgi:hypothetical protein